MAGNSQRRGAVRRSGTKKDANVGSGGQRRKALQGKGPTPKAEDRPGHPAARERARQERRSGTGGKERPSGGDAVTGRNAVLEALQADVPATELWVLDAIDADDRVRTAVALAEKRGVLVRSGGRRDLDGYAHGPHHQGLVLRVEPFGYRDLDDLGTTPAPGAVVVALDHVTDPHNLGAIARSALAFGATGLIVPQRRAAPVTSAAWKSSAGALARLPVVQVSNLVNSLTLLKERGYFVVGLDGAAQGSIAETAASLSGSPVVLVVGSEGAGLSRLTARTCDVVSAIPMGGAMESLNASVAAGIALYALTSTGSI